MNVNYDVYPNIDMNDNTVGAFFALLRAGLWEGTDVNLNDNVNWDEVYQLAGEQSVIGVVLAGIEYSNVKPPQELLLQWIGQVQLLEQQNNAMNQFVADLIEKMRNAGINAILVKGQGIAQCYERPLWRSCGDIDVLLTPDNYVKAKSFLLPLGSIIEPEETLRRHFAIRIGQWTVEAHGTMRGNLSHTIDEVLDDVQKVVFCDGDVRPWMNGKTQVFLPSVNCDVVFVFSHILQHFFKGGIGLRQICDWCRLICSLQENIDLKLVEHRIKKMRLMSEWRAFSALAVEYLGMPVDAVPFYDYRFKHKSEKIKNYVMKVGNLGHNRDLSYYHKKPYIIRKCITARRQIVDLCKHVVIFPLDSMRFFFGIMYKGLRSAIRGE